MAGEKLSTRQKMINLMYLVLTAMLALQVSSAIIDKFIVINKSLERARGQATVNNGKFIEGMEKLSKEPAAPPNANALMAQANEVKAKSAEMVNQIEQIKTELISATGGTVEGGKYKNPNGESEVEVLMIGREGSKSGRAYTLEEQLNSYGQYVAKITGKTVEKMAYGAEEDKSLGEEQAGKDFANLNFQATPMAAALAVLSQKQSEVVRLESEALSAIAEKLGKVEIKPDKIEVNMAAESQYVASGSKYKAEMFLAAGFSGVTPTMTYNGSNAPVSNGRGKIEFVASLAGGSPVAGREGTVKKTWAGEIRFKTTSGKDTSFKKTFEYFVVKPAIQIQSATVQALYLNCGNDLSVQVPALGSDYRPVFGATNGCQIIQGNRTGFITLVPVNPSPVVLSVSSGGNQIGTQEFKVRPIPKPTVSFRNQGREVNLQTGESSSSLGTQLQALAVPDAGFAAALPQDARYKVTSWDVTLVRGRRPVAGPIPVGGDYANIAQIKQVAQPGDRIFIKVNNVARMNFRGIVETAQIAGSPAVNIPIN
jgi:gliding motility-associated protein GldM